MADKVARTILLIGGEWERLVFYQAALREHGLRVIASTDPVDAIHMSSRFPFSAAIIDGDLQTMDVGDVIIALRLRNAELPILLIAGHQKVPLFLLTEVAAVLRHDSLDAFCSKLDWVLEVVGRKDALGHKAA